MKKISVLFFSVILMTAFTACDGSKKSEAPAQEPVKSAAVDTVAAPAPQVVAPALSPAEMLKNFQDYAKAYGEAFNNLLKDPKKYSELAAQSQKRVAEMENIKGDLNKKQLQDYQKALGIVLKVNRGGK